MALPALDSTFAGYKDLPTKQILASWLANKSGAPLADCLWYSEKQIWAKLAVAYGGDKEEWGYIGLAPEYSWAAILASITGTYNFYPNWSESKYLQEMVASYYEVDDCCFQVGMPIKYLLALMVMSVSPAPFTFEEVIAE